MTKNQNITSPTNKLKKMNKNITEIKISQSRLAGLLGCLFPGLIAFMLIDNKYGNQLFELTNLPHTWYWGAITLSSIAFLLLGKQALFPKTIFLMNPKGIGIGLGEHKRGIQFIPWQEIEEITKTKIKKLGCYTTNSITKKQEPIMISAVKIKLTKKYKECGHNPSAFIQGDLVFITETRTDDETFIKNLLHFKEQQNQNSPICT